MLSQLRTTLLPGILLLSLACVVWGLAAAPVLAQVLRDDTSLIATPGSRSNAQPLPADQAFSFNVVLGNADTLQLHWAIEEGYYLYRKSISLSSDPAGSAGPLEIPAGTLIEDMFFGEVEIFRQSLRLDVPFASPQSSPQSSLQSSLQSSPQPQTLQLTVEYQGCADIGYCYPMQSKSLTLQMP